MSRSFRRISRLLFVPIWFSLCSCNGEQLCFNPPLLTDTGGLGGQVNLDADALPVDASRDASFSADGKFTGHVFGISGQTNIDAVLSAHQGSAAPAMALYGPRSNDGLFGVPIAQTCGSQGKESRLSALMLDRPGDYLILAADPAGVLGDYSVELNCNSGCDQPRCEPLVCNLYCPAGLVRNDQGCPVCQCTAGCLADEDCPWGFECVNGTCRLESPCGCENQPYHPVCGVDSHTYANDCELECVGVQKAHDGACAGPGCTSNAGCPAGMQCINGECVFVCDCTGHEYEPVCGTDRRTYFNDCERVCAGVGLSHLGECDQCNPEICDGIDNDCDGIIDDGVCGDCTSDADCQIREICWNGTCVGAWPCDSDDDCPEGQVCVDGICRGDVGCDPEICDGIDNDCDGQVDEGCPTCQDQDADGFTNCDGDCNDLNPTVHPQAIEVCDGLDNNCNSIIDEGFDFFNDPDNCGGCDIVCPDGSCYQGACVAAGCQTADDCDDGDPNTEDHCANQVCVNLILCSSDAACTATQACVDGICMGHGSCMSDSDCPAGANCFNGLCLFECRTGECPTGQVCLDTSVCAP